jgi:hypothetical protein
MTDLRAHFEIECVDGGAKRGGGDVATPGPTAGCRTRWTQIDIEIETLVSSMPSAMIVSLSHSVLARLAWENSTGRSL